MTTYEFRFDPRYARYLSLLGVRPRSASVTVERDRFDARFGPWVCETSIDNVVGTEVSGPYSPLKAIGARVSFKDRGLTFGSNAERGVCIKFREPVRGIEPSGRVLRHPGLTVTVADVDGLAAELASLRAP